MSISFEELSTAYVRDIPNIRYLQLCRFFISLANHNIIDLSSDADTAEMKHFTLRNSRIEVANSLYRTLALGGY